MYLDDPRFQEENIEIFFNPDDLSRWEKWQFLDLMLTFLGQIRRRNSDNQMALREITAPPHPAFANFPKQEPQITVKLRSIKTYSNSIIRMTDTAIAYLATQQDAKDSESHPIAESDIIFDPADLSRWENWDIIDLLRMFFNEMRQRNFSVQAETNLLVDDARIEQVDPMNLDPAIAEKLLSIQTYIDAITSIIDTAIAYVVVQKKIWHQINGGHYQIIGDPRYQESNTNLHFNEYDFSYWESWDSLDLMGSFFNEIRQRNMSIEVVIRLASADIRSDFMDLSNIDPEMAERFISILTYANSITQIINTATTYIAKKQNRSRW